MRHDAHTFRFAIDHIARHRPRVIYLALGETDDWAHDGRYDRVLDAYSRTDRYLKQIWTWLQSQRDYHGQTSLLITTDHGRGRRPSDWRDHGRRVKGASETWMAFVSPQMPQRGECATTPRSPPVRWRRPSCAGRVSTGRPSTRPQPPVQCPLNP